MNNIKRSLVALLLSSTYAFSGGNATSVIEPIAPIMEPAAEPELSGFYAGIGYSCLQLGFDVPYLDMRAMTAASITAGYNFNDYIAVEGRYTASIGDITVKTIGSETDESMDMSNIGVYIKPQYSFDKFGTYALLGFGQVSLDNGISYSEAGIQYGAGFNLMATDNITLFVDLRRLYDDTGFDNIDAERDVMSSSYTLGVNYLF